MLRALILLASLLLPSLALAQPPAPVGGDMSNTTTKATGSTAQRLLGDRAADRFTPRDFGAIADGATHPLSTRYSSLAAAQAVCPEATSLTQEIDWCAAQAAIDVIAGRPVVAGVPGTPGGTLSFPSGTYKFGTTSLVANKVSLTVQGDDQRSSAILVGATPWLAFGMNNQMGIGSAVIAATGSGYVVNDLNTLDGTGSGGNGTCEDPPILTIATVGTAGDILTQTINHAGSCSVKPTGNLGYSTSGIGQGALFTGTWSGSGPYTLTSAGLIQGTGTSCVNGEVLTGIGGATPGGSPTQFTLTVTNAVAGVIQRNGVSITTRGAYGTPPPNPVSVTGSASCTAAKFNIGAFTNSGGSLSLKNLQFVADGAGVSLVNAQFNLSSKTTSFHDLLISATGTNYFASGFNLSSLTTADFRDIDGNNNLTYFNSNPSSALFVMTEQNNLVGHFENYWQHVSSESFTGGVVDYKMTATDTVPFQGLFFERVVCGFAAHCLQFENLSKVGYGNVHINNSYFGQAAHGVEMTGGIDVRVSNSGFALGQTRLTSPPSQADLLSFTNVNQWHILNNTCATALTVTPSVTCFHIAGTSSFGVASNNVLTNAARVPTMIGYVFDSAAGSNLEANDNFVGGSAQMTPVQNAGIGNITMLSPYLPPCLTQNISTNTTSTPYQMPDGTTCLFITSAANSTIFVNFPVNPTANQQINFTTFNPQTALTVQVAGGSGQILGAGMPTTITPATPFAVKFLTGRWQRI